MSFYVAYLHVLFLSLLTHRSLLLFLFFFFYTTNSCFRAQNTIRAKTGSSLSSLKHILKKFPDVTNPTFCTIPLLAGNPDTTSSASSPCSCWHLINVQFHFKQRSSFFPPPLSFSLPVVNQTLRTMHAVRRYCMFSTKQNVNLLAWLQLCLHLLLRCGGFLFCLQRSDAEIFCHLKYSRLHCSRGRNSDPSRFS